MMDPQRCEIFSMLRRQLIQRQIREASSSSYIPLDSFLEERNHLQPAVDSLKSFGFSAWWQNLEAAVEWASQLDLNLPGCHQLAD
jgi:hypothetical protein